MTTLCIRLMDWVPRSKSGDVGISKVISCPENQNLIFNICPIDFYHLSSDQNFN